MRDPSRNRWRRMKTSGPSTGLASEQQAGQSIVNVHQGCGGKDAGKQGFSGPRPWGTTKVTSGSYCCQFRDSLLLEDPGRPASPNPILCLRGETCWGTSFTGIFLLVAFWLSVAMVTICKCLDRFGYQNYCC